MYKRKPSRTRRVSEAVVVLPPPVSGAIKAGDFKARCLDLMDVVQERGMPIIITKHGHPVAKLVPVDDAPASPLGFLAGTVHNAGLLVGPDHGAWAPAADPLAPTRRAR